MSSSKKRKRDTNAPQSNEENHNHNANGSLNPRRSNRVANRNASLLNDIHTSTTQSSGRGRGSERTTHYKAEPDEYDNDDDDSVIDLTDNRESVGFGFGSRSMKQGHSAANAASAAAPYYPFDAAALLSSSSSSTAAAAARRGLRHDAHSVSDNNDEDEDEVDRDSEEEQVDPEYKAAVAAAGIDYRQLLRNAAQERVARRASGVGVGVNTSASASAARPGVGSRALMTNKKSTKKKKKKKSRTDKYRDRFKEPDGKKRLHPERKKKKKTDRSSSDDEGESSDGDDAVDDDVQRLFDRVYAARQADRRSSAQNHFDPVGVCRTVAECPRGDARCARNPAQYPCLTNAQIQLEPQQQRCVIHMFENESLLVEHIVGAGKTYIAAGTSVCLLAKYPRMRCWMITPAGLVQNMKDTLTSYGVHDFSRYHFMGHDEFYRAITGTSKSHQHLASDALDGDLVVIDEAHEFRNPDGKRAQALLRAIRHAAKLLLMTATSAYNFPSDTCVQLAMMYRTDQVFHLDRFNEMVDDAIYHGQLPAARMIQNLFRCLISIHDYVDLALFPEAIDEIVSLPMSVAFYKKYKVIEEAEEAKMREMYGRIDPTVFYTGLRQAVNDANLDNDAASPKPAWVMNCIVRNPGVQVVVFSAFLQKGTSQLFSLLDAAGIRYGWIYGGMPQKERLEQVRLFNAQQIQIMLLSKAGGQGLNLKRTEIMIGLEPGWQQAGTDQFKGRGRRRGSHANMPLHRRRIKRYDLVLEKPGEPRKISDYMKPTFNGYEDERHEIMNESELPTPSVDHYLLRMSRRKHDRNMRFKRLIEPVSIEYLNCSSNTHTCVVPPSGASAASAVPHAFHGAGVAAHSHPAAAASRDPAASARGPAAAASHAMASHATHRNTRRNSLM